VILTMSKRKRNTKMRLQQAVEEFLTQREEASTGEVFDYVNSKLRYGTTMNQLGNILAKKPQFKDTGAERKVDTWGGRTTHKIWAMKKE
tara:strand:+ start:295 stop:561 length:267 start_codon:yes stop_codon:yes gene_type:complete